MAKPKNNATTTIRATLAAWAHVEYGLRNLTDALAKGDQFRAVSACNCYGPVDKKSFGDDYLRVGDAEITIHVVARDALTRNAVEALNAKLAEARREFAEKQSAILAEISKLQALEFVPADSGSTS
jgi:hypothetical protein